MPPTNEEAKAYAAGLVEELRFAHSNLGALKKQDAHPDRIEKAEARLKNITAELERVTKKAKSPAKRAEKR